MDLYQMLIGGSPEGPEQMQMAAQALRRKNDLGILGMLTGDQQLGQVGGALLGNAQRGAQQMQQTRQADRSHGLQERKLQLAMENAQREAANKNPINIAVPGIGVGHSMDQGQTWRNPLTGRNEPVPQGGFTVSGDVANQVRVEIGEADRAAQRLQGAQGAPGTQVPPAPQTQLTGQTEQPQGPALPQAMGGPQPIPIRGADSGQPVNFNRATEAAARGTGFFNSLAAVVGQGLESFSIDQLIGRNGIFSDQQEAKQALRSLRPEIERFLVNNPRYPEGAVQRVRENMPDPDRWMTSPRREINKVMELMSSLDIGDQLINEELMTTSDQVRRRELNTMRVDAERLRRRLQGEEIRPDQIVMDTQTGNYYIVSPDGRSVIPFLEAR